VRRRARGAGATKSRVTIPPFHAPSRPSAEEVSPTRLSVPVLTLCSRVLGSRGTSA
jgi:hypothetical protein